MRRIYAKGIVMSLITGCLLMHQLDLSAQTAQTAQPAHPLTAVLKKITKIYGTRFVYEADILDKYDVDVAVEKGGDVEELLKKILYPRGLVFLYVKKNYYAIVSDRNRNLKGAMSGDSTLPSAYPARSQSPATPAGTVSGPVRRITGQVTDRNGRPVQQVTVSANLDEVVIATAGDDNGNYALDGVPLKGATLLFTSVGFAPREVTVKGESVVNVVLTGSSVSLQQVIVVGYGEKKKEDLTAAISTIDSKELNEDHASVAVSDMLAGRLTGLYVQKTGGAPGSGSDLKIRGLGTFQNSNPLIVVDGIPDRTIDELNATDIESVSVLKDAASIAVYGARAANGVILVTTKKGKLGKPEISFTSNIIDQRPTAVYKRLDSYQYALLQNEALTNEGSFDPSQGLGFNTYQLQKYKDGSDPDHYPNTDWLKTLMRSSVIQTNYNLSASGGSENTKYFLSLGYVKNRGLAPVEDYSRWNLRSNLEANITRNLRINLNLAGILSTSNGEGVYGSEYIVSQAYATPPTRVNQFSNGYYAFVPEQRGNAYLQATGQTGFQTYHNNTLNSTFSLQYDLPWIRGLSLKGTAAYDKGLNFSKQFAVPYDQYEIDSAGDFTQIPAYPEAPYLSEGYTQSQSLTLEGSIQYAHGFGLHHVGALLLYTQTESSTDNFTTERKNFVSGLLPQLGLGDPTQVTNDGGGTQSARQGMVGRLSYDYAERYLLEFSFRYDGSDIFPPGHRFGFFPSVSGGWILSEEPWFKEPLRGLDFLKIRGSWGELGNDRVDPYQFLSTYSLIGGNNYTGGGYTFGGPNPIFYQSLQANVLPNPSFTWERAVMTDIGIEVHYKKDLLTLEADYFYKRTKDILTRPALLYPSVIGLGLPDFNSGIVDNSGFEISLGHTLRLGRFSYFIQPNISFNQSTIVYFPESRSTPSWQKITGAPVSSAQGGYPYIGYHSLGLYQSQQDVNSGPTPLFPTVAPGDIRYADLDKDGAITYNDNELLRNHFFPQIQYGIRWGIAYTGIELNVLLQGSGNVAAYNPNFNYNMISASSELLERWTPQHTNASFPRLWINYQNNVQVSDYWVVNTAYMRVKNIELAYSLPARALGRSGIKSLRISLTGNNLLTFSRFKLFDPEAAGQVRDPLIKSFTAGASLQF